MDALHSLLAATSLAYTESRIEIVALSQICGVCGCWTLVVDSINLSTLMPGRVDDPVWGGAADSADPRSNQYRQLHLSKLIQATLDLLF